MSLVSDTYIMGEHHSKWYMTVTRYQGRDGYKFVLSDIDDDYYIGTNFVTPSTANDIEDAIKQALQTSSRAENISDFYHDLQKRYMGTMFYEGLRLVPQLTDGVILLAI